MHSDAEVMFVGRFKEAKKKARAADGEYTFNVTSYSMREASSSASPEDTTALAVYPQRCAH